MASNNNCEPCNVVPGAPVTPAPVCPTPACEELVPTECVINNLLDDGCTSYLYQYDENTGGLIIDPQTNAPTPIVNQDGQPTYPLGLTISPGQNLNTILTNLVDSQNCAFNPNFIAGMLQIIQANPNHPVAQIFCNLVCSCVCDDEELCGGLEVEQAVFNPIGTDSVSVTWFALPGVTYELTFVNTGILPPQTFTVPGFVPNVPVGGGLYTLDVSPLQGYTLTPGAPYQMTITATSPQGVSCESITWFFNTLPNVDCDCPDVIIEVAGEVGAPLDAIAFNVIYVGSPSGTIPTQYLIRVENTTGTVIVPSAYYTSLAPNPTPVCFGNCDPLNPVPGFAGGDYIVYVTPVCEDVECIGQEIFETIVVAGPLLCDVPDIISITSNP
jgi:hypothetical protein